MMSLAFDDANGTLLSRVWQSDIPEQSDGSDNWRYVVAQLMRERREKTISLFMQLFRFCRG